MPYFDQSTETLPRDRLQALQFTKLQTLTAELWENNRFYTAKWKAAGVQPGDLKSLADLSRLPG